MESFNKLKYSLENLILDAKNAGNIVGESIHSYKLSKKAQHELEVYAYQSAKINEVIYNLFRYKASRIEEKLLASFLLKISDILTSIDRLFEEISRQILNETANLLKEYHKILSTQLLSKEHTPCFFKSSTKTYKTQVRKELQARFESALSNRKIDIINLFLFDMALELENLKQCYESYSVPKKKSIIPQHLNIQLQQFIDKLTLLTPHKFIAESLTNSERINEIINQSKLLFRESIETSNASTLVYVRC